MSILSLASDVSDRQSQIIQMIVFGVFGVFSLGLAFASRALPLRNPNRPDRIDPARPAWLLAAVLGAATFVYMLTAAVYLNLGHPDSNAQSQPSQVDMSPADQAVLSILPGLLGLMALAAGDELIRDQVNQDLGLGAKRVAAGFRWGVVGALIVIPMLFLVEYGVEQGYRQVRYEHESEHPLLRALTEEPGRGVRIAIVVGACIVAPLFEELLFRGHLQTLIRRMLYTMSMRRPPPALAFAPPLISLAPPGLFPSTVELPGMTAPPPLPVPMLPPPLPLNDERYGPSPLPSGWHTWGAILITSLLFALVHPLWSAPIIFVLAVCLGYAYELTGNLWVSIVIHAAFNSLSTFVFLIGLNST